MSNCTLRQRKGYPRKLFLDAIDQRNVTVLYNFLSSLSQDNSNAVDELSKGKLDALWGITCDMLLTLPPVEKPFLFPEKEETGTPSTSAEEISSASKIMEHSVEERTIIAMSLLKCTFPIMSSKLKEPPDISEVCLVLNNLFSQNLYSAQVMNISDIIWKKKWTGRWNLATNIFRKILERIHSEACTGADVKKLLIYREIVVENLPWLSSFRQLLVKCVSNKTVLCNKNCESFLAAIFTLDHEMLLLCHNEAKNILTSKGTGKLIAKTYGRVYGYACLNPSGDIVQLVQEECLQFFALKFIKAKWDIPNETMLPLGNLLQELLMEFHAFARKHPTVLSVLVQAYEPILWRNLDSSKTCYRINASIILLDVFPLELPNAYRDEAEKYLNMQYKYIVNMLVDDCHLVRLIAVKEVCRILTHYWECVPLSFKLTACKTLITKLAFDSALPEIRARTLQGLAFALEHGPYSIARFMGPRMKVLRPLILDESKKVAQKMINFLLVLQKMKHPKGVRRIVPTCWEVVPPPMVINRLAAEDSSSVLMQPLVELMFVSIHPESIEQQRHQSVLRRVSWLIKTSLPGARNFYENSSHCMSLYSALKFMQKVLSIMYYNCKRRNSQKQPMQLDSPPAKQRRKSSEDKENTYHENVFDSSSQSDFESLSNDDSVVNASEVAQVRMSDPLVVRGLLEVILILWRSREHELRRMENKLYCKKLLVVAKDSVIEIYKVWKDNVEVMHPLLLLASLLPKKRLRTLVSYSLSQLKLLMLEHDKDKISNSTAGVILNAMCNWNSGDEVVEMVTECLNTTIQNVFPNKKPLTPRKNKRVKFEAREKLNPEVAVQYINLLMKHPSYQTHILLKSHIAVCELLTVLQSVEKIVEIRLKTGNSLRSIDDDMIHLIHQRYVYLIPLMKSPIEHPYNVPEKYLELTNWVINFIIPFTSEEMISKDVISCNVPFVARVLLDFCRGAGILIHCTHLTTELAQCFIKLCKLCLNSYASQYLILGTLCIMSGMAYQYVCEINNTRDVIISNNVSEEEIINLVYDILLACNDAKKLEMVLELEDSERKIESNIEELLHALVLHFQKKNDELARLARNFLRCILTIAESEQGIALVTIPDLPYAAKYLLTLFLESDIPSEFIESEFVTLVYGDFGNRDTGRAAVSAVISTITLQKWKHVLTDKQKDKCNQALESCTAAAIDSEDDA